MQRSSSGGPGSRPTAEDAGVIGAASRSALRLQDDQRLVALARAGSDPAFEAIVERYRAPLLRYSRRVLGPDHAEDVVQQTFLSAYRALHRDARDIELRPWLYRIAHNTALNVLARVPPETLELDDQFDGVPQPPDIAERHARLDALVAGIQDLPDRQRIAIVLRELEGRSHEQIAREIDATAPVVRQLIYRARTKLRDVCGLLVPLPVVRALLSLQAPGGAGTERAAELAAGAGTGGVLVKLGATVLATGAIATGIGGTREARVPHRAETATPAVTSPATAPPITAPRTVTAVPAERSHARTERTRPDRTGGLDRHRAPSGDQDDGDRDRDSDEGGRGKPGDRAPEHDSNRGADGGSEAEPEQPEVHEAGNGERHGAEQPQPDEPQEPPAPEDDPSGA